MVTALVMSNTTGDAERRSTFARMLMSMDDGVKQVINELDSLHQTANSIIVVVSDNGGCPSEGASNYPLRGTKFTQFQGGVKVPAFVFSPLMSTAAQGSTYDSAFHVSDWLPTLARPAGATEAIEDQLDGLDLWNAINLIDESSGNVDTTGTAPVRSELILHFNPWDFPRDATDMSVRATVENFTLLTGARIVNDT
eukprot:FR736020.1.p1 GENE.FR736020.1~~FR736020.1.p1  ORF type:complete len:196 (+),score=17.40 FR736020.1:239-826(+)